MPTNTKQQLCIKPTGFLVRCFIEALRSDKIPVESPKMKLKIWLLLVKYRALVVVGKDMPVTVLAITQVII